MKYVQLDAWTRERTLDQSAAEIHGLLTGWLCAGAAWDKAGRIGAISQWLDVDLSGEDFALLESIYNETAEGLVDEAFGFRLLIPDDDAEVSLRSREMSGWCAGFLYGFGMTGKYQNEDLSQDVSEIMSDVSQIAAISEEVPEDEENEADLIEIAEYVRMSAMLVYAECGQKALH